MKKRIAMLLLLTVTLACSDAKKNTTVVSSETKQTKTDDTKTDEVFISAKINGIKFYSDNPRYTKFDDVIDLSGLSEDKTEKILFQIVYDKGPSTYTMGKATNKKGNMIYTMNSVPWIVSIHRGEGTITLKEEGEYLKGKFSFTGIGKNETDKKQITDGKFRVKKK